MNKSWIVVSNSAHAQIYCSPRAKLLNGHPAQLTLVREFDHPQSRLRKQDLVSDTSGRWGHSQYAMTYDPVDLEAEHFAHELTDALEDARVHHEFDDLIIIGPSHFLGKINHCLKDHHALQHMVSVSINKDYVGQEPMALASRIKAYL